MSCQIAPNGDTAPPAPRTLLSQQEVADHLGVTIRTLQRWRAAGMAPPHYQVGPRRLGYDRRDVVSWIAARRVKQDSPAA